MHNTILYSNKHNKHILENMHDPAAYLTCVMSTEML